MAKKRKHHYLPQFYISNFCNSNGEVFVWNKEERKVHKQGKNGTFHIPYFYSVDFSKFQKRNPATAQKLRKVLGVEHADTSAVKEYPDMIEDLLGESENEAANVIRKLLQNQIIYDEDKKELAIFIGFMYARTPSFRERSEKFEKVMYEERLKNIFAKKEKVTALLERMRQDGYEKEVDISALMDFVHNKKYIIGVPKELLVQNMLFSARVIDQLLYKKTWFVVRSKEGGFITTDNPVFLLYPELGFEPKENQVFFPISNTALLVMQETEQGQRVVVCDEDEDEVNRLNKLIASRCNKYVISTEETPLGELVKSVFLGKS